MYYSNGKLLLSGEYLVLLGARSLAVPVKYGQSMEVFDLEGTNLIQWEASVMDQFWFHAEIAVHDFKVYFTNDQEVANRLSEILKATRELNPGFLAEGKGCLVRSNINFNRYWGLGTSSSLISNIAYWSDTDPFQLHKKVSKGSGFDIACARAQSPILFQLVDGVQKIQPSVFDPPFKDQLYFAYLGKKQNSENSVIEFLNESRSLEEQVDRISHITDEMSATGELNRFIELMHEHEEIISEVLEQPTIKKGLFSDFPLEVKSLGAWGGDFLMIAWKEDEKELIEYLKKKDIFTVFSYNELFRLPDEKPKRPDKI